MADVKTTEKTLYNTSDGPRSVVDSDGSVHVVRPGDSVTATFTSGELDDLHPDLSTSKPKASDAGPASGEPVGSAPGDQTADDKARAIEELATQLERGNTRDALLDIAKA